MIRVAAWCFDVSDSGLRRLVQLGVECADAVPIPVIASGGVGSLDHLVDGVTEGHASAVLAASIFHFGTYSIAEAKAHMQGAGLKMRLDS